MGTKTTTMSAPELNLSAVTLYKNNLGFFERTAAMEEGETSASGEKVFSVHVPLDRKGMIVDTLTAAEDATIKYDSVDEAATRSGAEEDAYGFTLSHNDGLGGFLSSCPGAKVKVDCGPIDGEPACTLEGKLLMMEKEEQLIPGTEKNTLRMEQHAPPLRWRNPSREHVSNPLRQHAGHVPARAAAPHPHQSTRGEETNKKSDRQNRDHCERPGG